jgi:hypothetical protein
MKQFLGNIAQHLAPRTVANLRKLNALDPELTGTSLPQLVSYQREIRGLRREIDELRRENRRVAELYDVFFQLAHQNLGTPVPTSDVDAPETVKRVADVLSKNAWPDPPSVRWQLVSRCPASFATLRALRPRSACPR